MTVAQVGMVVLALLTGCGGGSTSGTGGDACQGQVSCNPSGCCPQGDYCFSNANIDQGATDCVANGQVVCCPVSCGSNCTSSECGTCPASEGCGAAVGTCG
jgi:hypothetical protein